MFHQFTHPFAHIIRRTAALVLLVGPLLAPLAPCRAENYALVIGIDQYKQSQRIATLEGATNDARALAKTLQDVAGFPAANVTLLVSGTDPEPSASNISDALDSVIHKIKPGDTLYLLYSGHGIDMDGKSYLVPWDADARTDASLQRTVLPTAELRDQLAKVPVKTLLMAFDMCRTDPRKGSRDLASNNLLGPNQARDLHIVPAKSGKGGPQDVITLFACSEGERSWEWEDKQRGYFSYYLEQGLRHDAADNHGVVHASNLVAYLQKSVYGAVETAEGEAQTPYPLLDPQGAADIVLASGEPAGTGGTIVTATDTGAYDTALQQGFQFYQAKQYVPAQAKFQQALGLQPNSAKAADGLGRTYQAQNNARQAETYFRQAVQADANDAHYAADLADVLAARGDAPEAVPLYRAALQLDPGNITPVLSYADLSRKTRDTDTAHRLLIRATRINPKDPHPWDMQGEMAFDAGDYPTAERNYRQAVNLDKFGGQYLAHLVKCLYKEGKMGDAQQMLNDAGMKGVKIPGNLLPGGLHLPFGGGGGFHL
jgi:tetratricopeptide (TPR) repeat protein